MNPSEKSYYEIRVSNWFTLNTFGGPRVAGWCCRLYSSPRFPSLRKIATWKTTRGFDFFRHLHIKLLNIWASMQMAETIVSTAAWKGSDIVDDPRWQFSLDDADIAEIEAALQHTKKRNLDPRSIGSEHFPLDIVKTKFAEIALELEDGCGFARLSGLPDVRWSRKDLELVWMRLASHLGQPVYQNPDGQLLREIRAELGDVGKRHGQLATDDGQFLSSRARTASNAELRYHTDRTDIVSLLCTGVARRGGLSKIVSSVTVHYEMLARYPNMCDLLYLDLPRSRVGEETGGENAWYQLPVWGVRDGKFSSHYSRVRTERKYWGHFVLVFGLNHAIMQIVTLSWSVLDAN